MIIDQLSSGLYENPAACLKELVNNSFDADATRVTMSVRPDADLIIIEDDGTGFSANDFKRHFARIARSYKREDADTTPSGRPKIGKIGIGFIAANEICERLEIISTVAGSTQLMSVTLDFDKMRLNAQDRARENDAIAKGDYYGELSEDAELSDHFTRIYLRDVRETTRDVLDGARRGKGSSSLYGLSEESVRDRLARPSLTSWSEFDLYSQTVLEIALNVPVGYHQGWAAAGSNPTMRKIQSDVDALNFELVIDGTPQKKPTVFRPDDGRILTREIRLEGDGVSARGYLFAYDHKLHPTDINGLLVRIRNAAVGKYDSTYLEYPGWQAALFQDWVSGEVYVDDRLEDALNIDRRTFRTTHPAYVELQRMLHEELRSFFAEARRVLYGKRSEEKKLERAIKEATEVSSISSRLGNTPSPPPRSTPEIPPLDTAKLSPSLVPNQTLDSAEIRKLTATYRPSEVIALVEAAATKVGLTRAQISSLVSEVVESMGL
nr:ATP-binding protein [Terrimesophilobacter mesophilus]